MLDLGSAAPKQDRDGNPIYTTVCHGGSEDSHKLYYYKDSYHFHCYTNCGGGKDIYQLVMDVKATQGFEYTFPDALKYVAEISGKSFTTNRDIGKSTDKVDDWNWIKKVTTKRKKLTRELPSYNKNVLDVFMPYQNNWVDEGITLDIAKKYNIGWYFKQNQITIPHFSIDGRLIGIRSRNTDERAEMGMKYIPTTVGGIQYRHIVSHSLFGLNHTKEAIQRSRKVLFWEGEKSVLKSEKLFENNNFTVAVSGSNISTHQRDLVLGLNVEEVFIGFDKFREQKKNEPDRVYEKQLLEYQKKLVRLAHLFTPYCRTYILWDYEDLLKPSEAPIDQGEEVLKELMRNKIEIQTKDVVF